jgi:hypothetical protein
MNRYRLLTLALLAATVFPAAAQRINIGIAPTYDNGGEEFGPQVAEHITLFTFQRLAETSAFEPHLLNPGGVYTPLDTSWLTEYVQDRPELDLLLVSTLKPIVTPDKGSWNLVVGLTLIDAKSGKEGDSWEVFVNVKTKNALFAMAQSKGTSIVDGNSMLSQGRSVGNTFVPTKEFEKQPMGKVVAHIADQIRDTLPAHIANFKLAPTKVSDAPSTKPEDCTMHTHITYNYKHSASHSYTLVVDGLDEFLTIHDGISDFKVPSGPVLVQFSVNDSPYKLLKQPIYQLSAYHSCAKPTLVIDLGPGGDAHHHWE